MELNVCPICGSNYDYDDAKKRYYCRYCGHLKPKERPSEEETLLSFASQRLRLADFDGANEAYEDIVHRFPDSSEAHWGLALSSYGIKYEDDYDGKKIPSCYSTSYESLLESPHYKKAISLADDELRKWYEDQAKLIEKVRKEWVGKAEKEAPYDVFLSFKDTEDGKRTSDSYDAHEIYNQLTGLGYRVFFSRVSLQGKTGENYEPYIFAALNSAPCMLLFSSKPEYVTSTWVKNEWMRYLSRMKEGKKASDSLCVIFKDFSPSSLPNALKGKQNLKYGEITFLENLKSYVKKVVDSAKGMASSFQRKEVSLAKKKGQKSIEAVKKETVKSISKKTSSLSSLEVEKRSVGQYAIPTLSANEESKLNQAEVYLSMKQFGKAQKLYEEVLSASRQNAQALLGRLLSSNKVSSLDEFIKEDLSDLNKLPAALEVIQYSKKEVAFPLLKGYADLATSFAKNGEFAKLNKLYPSIASYDVPAINSLHSALLGILKEKLTAPEVFPLLKQCLTYLSSDPKAYRNALKELMKAYQKQGDFPKAQELLKQYEEYFDYDAEAYLLSLEIKAEEKGEDEFLLHLAQKGDFSSFSGSLPLDEQGIDDLFRILGSFATFHLSKYPKEVDALIRFLLPYSFSWRDTCIEQWLEACYENPNEDTAKALDGILHAFGDDSFATFLSIQKKFSEACAKKGLFELALKYADRLIEYDPDNPEHHKWRILLLLGCQNEKELPNKIASLKDYSDIEALISLRGKKKVGEVLNPYIEALLQSPTDDASAVSAVFDALTAYFPKEEDDLLFPCLYHMAYRLHAAGHFAFAEKYYSILVAMNPMDHESYWNIVLCKLSCKKEEEVLECMTPLSEFSEFENAKLATGKDKAALAHYIAFETKQAARIEKKNAEKKAERKRKTKKAVFIASIGVLVTAIVAAGVLAFTYFIPNGKVSSATAAIKAGNYDEAIKTLQGQSYGESRNLLNMAYAGKSFEGQDYEKGIEYVMEAGGEVHVTYDADGKPIEKASETIKPKRAYIENGATTPGYQIDGWEQTNFKITVDDASYAADLWLKASNYTLIDYEISYDLAGGTNNPANPTGYHVTAGISFLDPSREGYTFSGWVDENGNPISELPAGSTGNRSIKATWTANLNVFSLSSANEENGTAFLVSGTGYTDEEMVVSATPKEGYLFRGWFSEEGLVSTDLRYTFSMPTHDYSLSALFWTEEEKHDIGLGITPEISLDCKSVTYGLYPKDYVNDQTLLSALNKLTKTEGNGWYLYEGNYYAKYMPWSVSQKAVYHDGTPIPNREWNWFLCEPIKWDILTMSGANALVISDQLLNCGTFGSAKSYEDSSLRERLNGEFFFDPAFFLGKSALACTTSVGCDDNVFFLSAEEYNALFSSNEERRCFLTDYALANEAYWLDSYRSGYNYYGWYLTRSSDFNQGFVTVSYDGKLGYASMGNSDITYSGYGIRPATTIDLSEASLMRGSKEYELTVTSNDSNMGSAEVISGSGKAFELIEVEAAPKEGYSFFGWYDNGRFLTGSTFLRFNMLPRDYHLEARFQSREQWLEERAATPVLSEDGKTVRYGLYPQSHVNDASLLSALRQCAKQTLNDRGWYYYDGVYYVKKVATPNLNDDEEHFVLGEEEWFRCDPIDWKVLSNSGGKVLLLAYCLLDVHSFGSQATCYEDSAVRKWLNSDFRDSAFQWGYSLRQTTLSHEGAADTIDYAFLLNRQDYLNPDYGFSSSENADDSRISWPSDYACASGAFALRREGWGGYYSPYFTRDLIEGSTYYISTSGAISSESVSWTYDNGYGVRPAITVSL